MNNKQKYGIIITLISLVAVIVGGGGSVTNWTFDFSTTNIGQIGDNITNEFIQNNFGINFDKFRENCKLGFYQGRQAQDICDLI